MFQLFLEWIDCQNILREEGLVGETYCQQATGFLNQYNQVSLILMSI